MSMDQILSGKAGQMLLNHGMDPGVLRPYIAEDGKAYVTINGVAVPATNATLRKDEWIQLDTAVVQAARDRLVGVNYLISKGLVYNVPGMSKTVLEYETVSDMTDAVMSMDGVDATTKDRVNYELGGLPLPITHKGFQISSRVLGASRTQGTPLDTTNAESAARKVAEKIENTLFAGASSYKAGTRTLYGMLDFPQRNSATLAYHWNDTGATGETILADVLEMKQALMDDGFYGPYALFVPGNFETALDEDFKANSDKSTLQRLKEIRGLSDILVADYLTDDKVVLVQLTKDVIRVVNGLAVTTMQWEEQGGLLNQYLVMSIMVPQIRCDQANKCGLVVAT